MTRWPLLRFFVVFFALLVPGVLLLVLLGGPKDEPPRRGLRITTTNDGPSATSTQFEGMPSLLASDEPRHSHYETVEFTGPNGKPEALTYLAWHLGCDRVDMSREKAIEVAFRMFPTPTSLEEAREQASKLPEPVVTIFAGEAGVEQTFNKSTGQEEWILHLSEGTRILSRTAGKEAELIADDLDCYVIERRVVARGAVDVTADEYVIRGRGMEGDAALGTFSILEDVEAILPTAALVGEGVAPEATTRVSSPGPLLVERLENTPDGKTPSRITFQNGAKVVQPGENPASLSADELEIELIVEPREDGKHDVTVNELRADGSVVLEQGTTATANSEKLSLRVVEDGYDLELGGKSRIRYVGALPGAPGGTAPPGLPGPTADSTANTEVLDVTAGNGARIERREKAEKIEAVFSGGVTASRLAVDGETALLTLTSGTLRVVSEPEAGDLMEATGSARIETPSVVGEADQITWQRLPSGREEIRLSGSPRIEAEGGAGFKPFGQPAGDVDGAKTIIILESRGDTVLVTEDKRTTFSMEEGATVAKEVDGVETLRVQADEVVAVLEGELLSSLSATGGVTAEGQSTEKLPGRFFVSGDSFRYAQGELATLDGGAVVRLMESADRANQIEAARITFGESDRRVVAENGVRAVVWLRSDDGKATHPFTLACRRLEVVPSEGAGETGAAFVGSISSLVAEGDVSLSGRDRKAAGDHLSYGLENLNEIVLVGKPARVTETKRIHGKDYGNDFTSAKLRLTLRGEDISSAVCPQGGRFLLHREYSGDIPSLMGEPGKRETARDLVERLSGSCTSALSYDTVTAKMTGNARVEQSIGSPTGFRRMALFKAGSIEARIGRGADGEDEVVAATGKGGVHAVGDGWEAWCDKFDVDLVKHLITVEGSPARLKRDNNEQRWGRAVLDYVKGDWKEFYRLGTRR